MLKKKQKLKEMEDTKEEKAEKESGGQRGGMDVW